MLKMPSVGQVASDILRRGVELRYKDYSPIKKNSTFNLTQQPKIPFKQDLLDNNAN